MNIMDEIKRLDTCSSVEEIKECKRCALDKMESDHKNKMLEIEKMKARHNAEYDQISRLIREALGSEDFSKVQELLKKQAELIKQHGVEILSIM